MPVLDQLDTDAAIIAPLPLAVALFGPDTRLRTANPAFVRLFGLDGDWLETRPSFAELLNRLRELRKLPEQADFSAYRDIQLSLFRGTTDGATEDLMHLPGGGTLKRVAATLPDGGLVLSFEDLSGTLDARRMARESEAVQRATMDHLSEAIAVFGPDGRLRYANPALTALVGLEPGASPHLSGYLDKARPLYDIVAAGGTAKESDWAAARAAMVAEYLGRSPDTARLVHRDGRVFDFLRRPLPDGSVLLRYADISDSAEKEAALSERAEAMAAADRLKSEFLANLSFELRTPLTTIGGFAEILAGGYFGELNKRQKEYADGIAGAVGAMVGLIEDIFDLANIEAGLLDLALDSVDLHAALAQVLGLVRARARAKPVGLEFDCAPDIGWISADENRLKQAVLHLLGNAITFTPAGGKITLAGALEDGEVVITVRDTGIGIPKADLARVFRGFERGTEVASSDSGPGAGLGLTIVKSVIELHGGRVDIVSRPNRGTTVTCRLPRTPPIVASPART